MRKSYLIVLLLATFIMSVVTIGYDNRSQMQKDADKAMQKVDGALK